MEDKGGILYVVCGPPGSGKTTFLEEMQNSNEIVIHRDEIRLELLKPGEDFFSHETEVYCRFLNEVNYSIRYGYNTYADATHLNESSRCVLLYQLLHKGCNPKEIDAIYFNVPLKVCLERNEKRKGTRAYTPPKDIEQMYYSYTFPTYAEGFKRIWEIDKDWNITKISP